MSTFNPDDGHYASLFEPGSPAPRPVVLKLQTKTLVIHRPSNGNVIDRWSYDDLRALDQGEMSMEITNKNNPYDRLEIEDPVCNAELMRRAPKLNKMYMRKRMFLLFVAGWLGAIVAALGALYVAIPASASLLTSALPWEWQVKWGKDVEKTSFGHLAVCNSGTGEAILQTLTNQIRTVGEVDIPIETRVVDTDYVNMVVLPGGRLIIFRGLLERLPNSAALAGLMAHAIGHLKQRTVTEDIIRAHGFNLVLAGVMESTDSVGPLLKTTVADRNFDKLQTRDADTFTQDVLETMGIDITAHARVLRDIRRETDADVLPLMAHMRATYPETLTQSKWARANPRGQAAMTPGAWMMLQEICTTPSET